MRLTLLTLPIILLLISSVVSAAPRLLLIGDDGGTTSQALKALQVAHQRVSAGEFAGGRVSPFEYQVLVIGMDQDTSVLAGNADRLLAFIRSGGVCLAMRAASDLTWLPVPVKQDKAYHFGAVLKPEHPLFNQPAKFDAAEMGKVHSGSIYRAFYALGPGWVPLVSTGKEQEWDKAAAADAGPHYGIIELPYGKGRLILCQMIPEYGFISDDKSKPGPSSRFLENLLAYASSLAPNWPAPRPRVVPANFHSALSGLLKPPSPRGSLPLSETGWKVTSSGPYTCAFDRRGVMTVTYPDRPATAGAYLQLTRQVAVPPGGAFLRFYNSDDYCGGMEPKLVGDKAVGRTENRIKDTRLKQVLVNGKVVWEEDALGLNAVPSSERFRLVDISQAAKTGSVTIALRVEDRKSTNEQQPFATDVYWAGVEVLPGLVRYEAKSLQDKDMTLTDEGLVLDGKMGEATSRFSGPAGQYAVCLRMRDEHTGRSTVNVTVGATKLPPVTLCADDFGWYWINAGTVALQPQTKLTVTVQQEGTETPCLSEIALLPAQVLASQVKPAQEKPSPLYTMKPAVLRASFPVLVAGPERYKPQGEVVSGGMPFAFGAVSSEDNIRLLNDQNREVPLQTRVLAKWPDGSLKWVLFTFQTAPGALRCEYGTQIERAPAQGMALTQDENTISINTGPLQVAIDRAGGEPVRSISFNGKPVKTAQTPWRMLVNTAEGKQYATPFADAARAEVVEAGPVRVVVRRVGRLCGADGGSLLECDLTLQFDLNSGVIRVQPVLTHKESSAEEKLSLVMLKLSVDPNGAPQTVWVNADGKWVSAAGTAVEQRDDRQSVVKLIGADNRTTETPGKRQSGYHRFVGNGFNLDLIPRWFWQMYPSSVVALHDAGYQVHLSDGVTLHQGQAIWNDLAVRFSDQTAQPETPDFDALASPAVATADPGYAAATLALGEFAPASPALFPEYEQGVESVYKAYLAKREQRREYGLENFGDDTFEWGYGPSYTFWSNQEYDHHHGMLMQFLRSGDYRWWEIADQGARHYRDVDCYHWAPGREYLIGAPHHHNNQHQVDTGWVADHTVAGSSNGHSWVEGLISYYFMTGDPRAYETFNQMGDWYCWTVDHNQYGAGGQERGPGWTLVALSALYNATYDSKYLRAGNRVMDWLCSVQDPVRGVVSIPISEQPSYEGGSAFMHGIVARGAGRWYEATGDERGRLAAIGIADWLTSEAMGPEGLFYYKQAPRIKGRHSINEWQCFTALSYAAKYGDASWYGPLTEAHYNKGRAGERSIAWAPQSLAHLIPLITPFRAKLGSTALVLAPDQPAQLKVQIINTSGAPLMASAKLVSASAGVAVQLPGPLTLEAGASGELVIGAALTNLAKGTGELRLQVIASGKTREFTVPVQAVAQLVQLELTAAQGKLQAPFVLGKDNPPSASAPRDAAFTGNPRQPGERAGWIEWPVQIPAAGQYYLAAECNWLDEKGNSLFLQVGDGSEIIFGNDSNLNRWHWVRHTEALKLSAGPNVIRLLNREDGGQVRRVLLTNVEGRLPN